MSRDHGGRQRYPDCDHPKFHHEKEDENGLYCEVCRSIDENGYFEGSLD